MFIHELEIIIKSNGKFDTYRVGFFASVDAAYNHLTKIGIPTIVGQDDNSERAIKKSMLNLDKIHVIVPAHTDEETGVFVDEYSQDFVMFTYNVVE